MSTVRSLRSRLAVACLLLAACSKAPAHETGGDEPNRYRAAGFSYVPPAGWETRDFPGLKYKIATGPVHDGFAANLNVVDEAFSGPLKVYVGANLENMGRMMPNFAVASQADFETDDGVDGTRLVATSTQNDMAMRQVFYFIPGKGKFYVVTCSDLAQHEGAQETACDDAARSFRVD